MISQKEFIPPAFEELDAPREFENPPEWQKMTAEEFELKAKVLFGSHYARHLSALAGMNKSTIHQYAKGGPKGREVPRYMELMLHLFELAKKSGASIDPRFIDYPVPRTGRPKNREDEDVQAPAEW